MPTAATKDEQAGPPPRLLLITDRFAPGSGTRSSMARGLALEAAGAGCAVTVLTPSRLFGGSGEIPVPAAPGLRVRRSVLWGLFHGLGGGRGGRSGLMVRVFRGLEVLSVFLAAVACGRQDGVLILRAVPFGNIGAALKRLWNCGVFVQLAGDDLFPGRWGKRTFGLLLKALEGADVVHAPSLFLTEAIRRLHVGAGSRVRAAAPWLDLEPFGRRLSPAERSERRGELGVGAEDVLLICPGRLVDWKGVDVLLLAMAEVVAGGARARLLVLGDGPLRKDLENSARDLGLAGDEKRWAVRFVGEVADVPGLLALGDGCVLPARAVPDTGQCEGAGLAAIEAALCEVPLILGASGVHLEHFTPDHTALLVKPATDPNAYAAAIMELIRDGDAARKRAELARATIANVLHPAGQRSLFLKVLDGIRHNRQGG